LQGPVRGGDRAVAKKVEHGPKKRKRKGRSIATDGGTVGRGGRKLWQIREEARHTMGPKRVYKKLGAGEGRIGELHRSHRHLGPERTKKKWQQNEKERSDGPPLSICEVREKRSSLEPQRKNIIGGGKGQKR